MLKCGAASDALDRLSVDEAALVNKAKAALTPKKAAAAPRAAAPRPDAEAGALPVRVLARAACFRGRTRWSRCDD